MVAVQSEGQHVCLLILPAQCCLHRLTSRGLVSDAAAAVAELLTMGYYPTSMDDRCEAYVCETMLLQLRASILHQYPTDWSNRAQTLNAVGTQLYNHVCIMHHCSNSNTLLYLVEQQQHATHILPMAFCAWS